MEKQEVCGIGVCADAVVKKSFYELTKLQLASFLNHVEQEKRPDSRSPLSTIQIRSAALFRSWYPRVGRHTKEIHGKSVARVSANFSTEIPMKIIHVEASSADGSHKFVMELAHDKLKIETVFIPERGRSTICISTQVGCAQACTFCSTGKMGLLRNLTVSEIVCQVVLVQRWMIEQQVPLELSNIVCMGMGEPLDNFLALLEALEILTDTDGFAFSPNKVTVSTVGLLPQLNEFLQRSNVCLALSLHSPFDAERSRVMPVNKNNPLSEVLAVLKENGLAYGRKFMIQYTLIRGVNDSPAHADELCRILQGIPVKINLIPLNENKDSAYRRPGLGSVYQFQTKLKERGFVATVRLSKGRDVGAACGQLVQKLQIHGNSNILG